MCITGKALCNLGRTKASVSLRPTGSRDGSGSPTGCFPLCSSAEICGFTIMRTSVLDAATKQMLPLETSCESARTPSQVQLLKCLSTTTHNAFMCASTGATGRVGVAGRQLSSCSDDTADLESSPNGGFKVVEIQSFLLLIRFSKLFSSGRRM